IPILVDQNHLSARRHRDHDHRIGPLQVGEGHFLPVRQLDLVLSQRNDGIAKDNLRFSPPPPDLRPDRFGPFRFHYSIYAAAKESDCLDLRPFLHTLPLRMPRNDQLHKILLIGSGPIVIGQGCEFDYSGVQACKALREEGYEVVLVNSNPATIMTDPEFADRTYIEPITAEVIEAIIEREKPDALLPTMGGQT